MTVLSVSYPLAKVSPGTAGGAEQVLLTIDRALVQEGHRSLVLAPESSRCSGLLIPARIPSGVLDENSKREARSTFKHLLDRTLARYSVDVIHMHGIISLPVHAVQPGLRARVQLRGTHAAYRRRRKRLRA